MTGLPWARMDSDMPSHDKILRLISDPSPRRWQAVASYPFGIVWCAGHGTDGHIPAAALPFIHGTKATAALLVKYQLWIPEEGGWFMPNFVERQELATVTELKRAAQRRAARRTNCVRYHGSACGCWEHGSDVG